MLAFFFANSNGASSDCPSVAALADALNLDLSQQALFLQLKVDCCVTATTSVTCTTLAPIRVTGIVRPSLGLNGVISGSSLPSTLETLTLNNNAITGSIPSSLPIGLKKLELSNNQLTGSLPNPLPNLLSYFHISNNFLTGNLPPMPLAMSSLSIGKTGLESNNFSGTLSLIKPVQMLVSGNYSTDIIVQDSTLMIDSTDCDISNNPLFGNPHISNLLQCAQTGLYGAASLPNTVFKSITTVKMNTSSTRTSSPGASLSFTIKSTSSVSTSSTINRIAATFIFTKPITSSSSIFSTVSILTPKQSSASESDMSPTNILESDAYSNILSDGISISTIETTSTLNHR